jgi:hypothetical protein
MSTERVSGVLHSTLAQTVTSVGTDYSDWVRRSFQSWPYGIFFVEDDFDLFKFGAIATGGM